ncbi:MAG: methionine adenosyltransferase [Deltaproteobacteria bacterium]|nr:methionine adenosyltransferase [Deltaproteobacteria bacterium]
MKSFLFTSESVSEGHPDKVADQVSDGILDAFLAQDNASRVACETLVKTGMVVVAGEITSNGNVDYEKVARQTIADIGYTSEDVGFDAATAQVIINVTKQSQDIAQGVNENEGKFAEQGAGDQGLMFGFACDETKELMPLPIFLSHRLLQELSEQRRANKVNYLRPDSKSQVTVAYENGIPKRVDTVVISTQHSPDVSTAELESYVIDQVVRKVIPGNLLDRSTKYLINPTGRFVVGGPHADCGLTGRKIIVDTYGGYSRHGGGAFSGKDPSKVDRSAAYAARYVAKNVVAAGLAKRCEIQLAYAIGVAEPVSIYLDTFGTAEVAEEKIVAAVRECYSFSPRGIITSLDLLKPIYQKTASFGHFGRPAGNDGSFSWESTKLAEDLKRHAL